MPDEVAQWNESTDLLMDLQGDLHSAYVGLADFELDYITVRGGYFPPELVATLRGLAPAIDKFLASLPPGCFEPPTGDRSSHR